MADADLTGLNELFSRMEEAAKDFPEQKAELLNELGDELQQEVAGQVVASGINDGSGKVRGWQIVAVGSGRGYVAVRPKGEKTGGTTGRDSEGAITNYLEHGHNQHPGNYVSSIGKRLKEKRVKGYHFYSSAKLRVQVDLKIKARQSAEGLLKNTAERIAGK